MGRTCFERFFVPLNFQFQERCFCGVHLQTSTFIVAMIEILYSLGIVVFGVSYTNMVIIVYHALIMSATIVLLIGRFMGIGIFYLAFIVIMDFVSWFLLLFCGIWVIIYAACNGDAPGNGLNGFEWTKDPISGSDKTVLIIIGIIFILMYFVHIFIISLVYCDYLYTKKQRQRPMIIVNPTQKY